MENTLFCLGKGRLSIENFKCFLLMNKDKVICFAEKTVYFKEWMVLINGLKRFT